MSDIRGFVSHNPAITSDGGVSRLRMSNVGQLFVADWKSELVLEGRVFHMTVGTMAAGGNITLITGGGNGTTIDQDQPEFGVSVPSGTDLIPIEIHVSCQLDMDADGEEGNIIVTYDNGTAYAGDGSVTSETPVNLLGDSGQSSVATAFSAATGDITDPTVSGILAFETIQGSDNGTAGNLAFPKLSLHYEPSFPFVLRGPSAFYGYWGGTAALPGIASVIWAEVPSGRFNVIT